jgi:hypothetical protein
MAPTVSHESRLTDTIPYIGSLISALSSRNEKMERRAQSGSGQVAGFAVVIAILSAIIIGECRQTHYI